ncbi:MAG: hypothetical protein JNN07_09855 [Verrucomicrobiales bacterium]|nr:hypothetical protein [Verrucomicrobiales bacterium]
MTPEEQQREMLRNLDQTEHVLRENLAAPGLDGTARAHMEIALAHTREAASAFKSGHGRTVMEVVQEHDVFARRLHQVLQRSVQQFCPDERKAGETKPVDQAAADGTTMTGQARHQHLDNLEKAEAGLRSNLHMHCVSETVRAHMERGLSHVHESYIAVNGAGRARTVHQLVEHLEKVELLFNKLRHRSEQGIVPIKIRL